MGLLKNMGDKERLGNVNAMREDAKLAWESTHRLYAPRLPLPIGVNRSNIVEWVEEIEAIEDVGWVLEFWAIAPHVGQGVSNHSTPVALPLFRRPAVT